MRWKGTGPAGWPRRKEARREKLNWGKLNAGSCFHAFISESVNWMCLAAGFAQEKRTFTRGVGNEAMTLPPGMIIVIVVRMEGGGHEKGQP